MGNLNFEIMVMTEVLEVGESLRATGFLTEEDAAEMVAVGIYLNNGTTIQDDMETRAGALRKRIEKAYKESTNPAVIAVKKVLTAHAVHINGGLDDYLAEKHKAEDEALKRAEWVLEIKGDHTKGNIEISAVIKGTHGHMSWGWPNSKNKVIVLSCNSNYSCCDHIDPRIIDAATAVAVEIVNQKNAEKENA